MARKRVAPAPTEASDDASSRSQVTLRDAGKLLCDIRDKSKDVILKTLKVSLGLMNAACGHAFG